MRQKYTLDEITALQTAYKQAIYEVYSEEETIQLCIDQCCPRLDALLIEHYQPNYTWALITAYNPYSQCLSADENQQRHQRLVEHLQKFKLAYLPAVGRDIDGIWTPEQSLCIFGVELKRAIAIGQKFNQNAIVYGKLNRPIKLQWL